MFWLRKRYDFFKMLREQAEKMEESLRALVGFVRDPSLELGARVEKLEKEADDLRRILIDALNQTFVTPMDREDIFNLSRSIDDMVDYAKSTVEEMMLFEVKTNDFLRKMAEAIASAGGDISAAVRLLEEYPQACSEHLIRAKKTENLVEHIYRQALVELFGNPNVVEILKLREIYRHLSNGADRGDEAADIIGDILVKTR